MVDRDNPAIRAKRAMAEAKAAATEHVAELQNLLLAAERTATEISDGGDAYRAGVREISRRLAEHLSQVQQSIDSIQGRP